MKQLLTGIELQLLMGATARAFGEKPVRIWTKPCAEALAAYADCTCRWMKRSSVPAETLQADMHREALRLGRLVRHAAFFLNDRGHARLVFALYRGIGITLSGSLPGTVTVSRCYFSHVYTPDMCALISAMDDGVVSGIMGGGRLTFLQRITEGCACCRACLTRREDP